MTLSPSLPKTGTGKYNRVWNAQFRPFLKADLLLFQKFGDRRMMAKGYNVVASDLKPTCDVGNEFIGVGVFWSIPRTPRLALSLVPNLTYLGCDLPPAADVNPVFPASGNIEASA